MGLTHFSALVVVLLDFGRREPELVGDLEEVLIDEVDAGENQRVRVDGLLGNIVPVMKVGCWTFLCFGRFAGNIELVSESRFPDWW